MKYFGKKTKKDVRYYLTDVKVENGRGRIRRTLSKVERIEKNTIDKKRGERF